MELKNIRNKNSGEKILEIRKREAWKRSRKGARGSCQDSCRHAWLTSPMLARPPPGAHRAVNLDRGTSIGYKEARPGGGLRSSTLLGLKTKTKISDYREPFSRFYQDFGVNENENSYRKYGNEYSIFIRNWKRKQFQPLPTVFENYHIYLVIYRRYYRIWSPAQHVFQFG